jgi:hypothetical protein
MEQMLQLEARTGGAWEESVGRRQLLCEEQTKVNDNAYSHSSTNADCRAYAASFVLSYGVPVLWQ